MSSRHASSSTTLPSFFSRFCEDEIHQHHTRPPSTHPVSNPEDLQIPKKTPFREGSSWKRCGRTTAFLEVTPTHKGARAKPPYLVWQHHEAAANPGDYNSASYINKPMSWSSFLDIQNDTTTNTIQILPERPKNMGGKSRSSIVTTSFPALGSEMVSRTRDGATTRIAALMPSKKDVMGAKAVMFEKMREGGGKFMKFAGKMIYVAPAMLKLANQFRKKALSAREFGKKVVGVGLTQTKNGFSYVTSTLLLPMLLGMLSSVGNPGKLESPGELVKRLASEPFLGHQTRVTHSIANASSGMRHARKAALLLADAQERTRELQSLAEQVVLQARYLQENPKALCTGIPNLDGELLGETDHDGIPAAATLHWATR